MKLLVVSRNKYSSNGTSSVIRSYYSDRVFTGVDITFLFPTGSDTYMVSELENRGFKVVFLNNRRSLIYYFRLKRFIKENGFDAIHVNGSSALIYFEIRAAKKAGVPIRVAHSHSSSCKHKIAHRLLKPFLNRDITRAVACSDIAGRWMFGGGFTVLPNGVDVGKFGFCDEKRREARKDLSLEQNFVVGHVANMVAVKNQAFLLDVFAEIVKKKSDAKLLFVGDGKLRGHIEKKIKGLELSDKVILAGKRDDADRLYQAMDVFLLPSLYEGLPVTLVEAQAAGLKCFVSENVTKQADVTGNVEYLPIGEDNIDKWAEAVCLVGSHDRRAAAAKVAVSDFNIERSAEKLKALLNV